MTTKDEALIQQIAELIEECEQADAITVHDKEALLELITDFVTRGF